jgi:heme-degrading monooxygenase HmoA
MICCAFIFEPGEYDEDFLKLDKTIDIYARALPGFVRVDKWFSENKKIINSMYYFKDEATLEKLAKLPAHMKAKAGVDRWYNDYKIEVFEVKDVYGKSVA